MDSQDKLNAKIKAFRNEWNKQFDYHLKSDDGLNLKCMHSIIQELIVEVKENKLRNKDNINFFLQNLSKFSEKGSIIDRQIGTYISFIKKNISNDRKNYVLEACYSIIDFFKKPIYIDGLIDDLQNIFQDEIEIDHKFYLDLKSSINGIVCELILKGYSLTEVEKFEYNIFDAYEISDTGLFRSAFPCTFPSYKTYNLNNEQDLKELECAKSYLDNLSIFDRISALKSYFIKEKQQLTYVFTIIGIKGNDDFKFFEIDFMSDCSELSPTGHSKEKINENSANSYSYAYASVTCEAITPLSSVEAARDMVNKHLNLLCLLKNIKAPLRIDKSNWCALSKTGKMIYKTSNLTRKQITHQEYADSLDLAHNRFYILDYVSSNKLSQYKSLNSFIDERLDNALHWFRRAIESDNQADKLLFFWISIENLFYSSEDLSNDLTGKNTMSKIDQIREVLSSCLLLSELHSKAWDVYNHYRDSHLWTSNSIFPKELLLRSQILSSGESYIELSKFVSTLRDLLGYEKDPIMKLRLNEVINLFEDTKYQYKQSKSFLKEFSDDVLMIYRYRNLIVHNAQYNSFILPAYTSKAMVFCSVLINSILSKIGTKDNLNMILIGFKQHKDWYLEELEQGNNHIL